MLGDGEGAFRYLYRRALLEEQRIRDSLPAERRTLKELLEERGVPCVRLAGGGVHCFRRDELRRLAEEVPWYLHRLVRLPVLLVYHKAGPRSWVTVGGGDRWGCYLVGRLLYGRPWFCPEEVEVRDAERLLERYKTVFLLTVEVEVGRGSLSDAGGGEVGGW